MRPLILVIALVGVGITFAGQETKVTGQYIEDRSARVYGCPCEWSNDWMNAGREAVLAWNIQSGEFQGADLAGLRVVAVVAADFIVSESRAARRATLFTDSGAPPAQRRAGTMWIRRQFGDVLGRIVGEHDEPIEFCLKANSVLLRVGEILALEMRPARLRDDTQTWATLLYAPLIPLTSSNLGTTSKIRYSGPDLNVNWVREEDAITGYYGTFAQ